MARSRGSKWGLRAVVSLGVAAAGIGSGLLYIRGGHVVRGTYVLNHGGRDFDVAAPPVDGACPAAKRPACGPNDVCAKYLGAGGVYLEWQGSALLAGPFFSNESLLRVGVGKLGLDEGAVREGLKDVPVGKVRAIFAGHSHYDHIGDLPYVAGDRAPQARLLLNGSGATALAAYPELAARVTRIDVEPRQWITVDDSAGRPVFRLWPIPSRHAPHFDHYTWGKGFVIEPWTTPWEKHAVDDLRDGGTWAFLIDLLDPASGQPRFRVYYQDSANDVGQGWPSAPGPQDERAVDLAVLCVASHQFVTAAPEWLLARAKPAHVMLAHWEDFFIPRSDPLRFVPLLSDDLVDKYLQRVRDALGDTGQRVRPPADPVCGPSEPGFTWPLPGEWLRFQASAG